MEKPRHVGEAVCGSFLHFVLGGTPWCTCLKKDLARALELKCDGAVLKHAGTQAALDYQEVLVKTLVSSHKQKNKGLFLVQGDGACLLPEGRYPSAGGADFCRPAQRHRKVAPLALAGIMALLLVCSYSVVVQPAYYPSMEEITEGQYTPVTTWNSWLAQESDGGLHPLLQGGGAYTGQRQDGWHHAGTRAFPCASERIREQKKEP